MRPNNVIDSVREGDLGGDAIEMSFDENSFAHLMSVLTDLYKNPELAVIREYSTNARDAHIEAGNPAPIEVFTPTALSPFFRVKDYGVGMDHDTIANTYSKYGASTKRGGDDQTGMLGLGCKSGLTYTNQFTVIGVKDGVKTTVVVSRNEDGSGVMQVVDTCATDEHNGVEITIPAKPGHFTTAVRRFFMFWPEGSVLIDGEAPPKYEYSVISDRVRWVRQGSGPDYVIMGGVPYEIDMDRRRVAHKQYSLHFYVPMGAVNFTPSRESLHYTSKTLKVLEELYDEFEEGLIEAARLDVSSQTEVEEAVARANHYKNTFLSLRKEWGFKWRGHDIPENVQFPIDSAYEMGQNYSSNTPGGWGTNSVKLSHVLNKRYYFVTGFEQGLELNAARRKKIHHYLRNIVDSSYRQVYVIVGDAPDDFWFSFAKDRMIDWDKIKPYKVPRDGVRSTKVFEEPAYDVCGDDGIITSVRKSDIETLAKGKDIVYFSSAQITGLNRENQRSEVARTAARTLAKNYGVVVVMIGQNRWDKFTRDFPNARNAKDWMNDYVTQGEKAMTDGEKLTLVLNDDGTRREIYKELAKLSNEIDDPEVVRILSSSSTPLGDFAKSRTAHYNLARRFSYQNPFVPDLTSSSYIEKTYPLAARGGRGQIMKDVVLYMNAKYATIKDGK